MQCLYCGKGIGPIRLLRDPEFCSEAHRTQFRELYRQKVYEALAPEPAPSRTADFIGRAPVTSGPAPVAALEALPKAAPGGMLPGVGIAAAGVQVERPQWVTSGVAAMPMRLAWQPAIAILPPAKPEPLFRLKINGTHGPLAQLARTPVEPVTPAMPPRPAGEAIAQNIPLAKPSSLPEPATIAAPAGEVYQPRLTSAAPFEGDPAAVGPVPRLPRAPVMAARRTAIAGPASAPAQLSAAEVKFAPAVVAGQPRPLEAGPLAMRADVKSGLEECQPVVFDATGSGGLNVILPRPPAVAASSSWIAAIRSAQLADSEPRAVESAVRPACPVSVPGLGKSVQPVSGQPNLALAAALAIPDPQPAAAPQSEPKRVTVRIEEHRSIPSAANNCQLPRIECAVLPASSLSEMTPTLLAPPVEAKVEQAPRSADIKRPALPVAPMRRELAAVTARMEKAPISTPEEPQPAGPATPSPTWDAVRAAMQYTPLVPLANAALPQMETIPLPAGALGGPGVPLRAEVSRLVRSSAILWTLHVARICQPLFRIEAVRADFLDLLRSDRSPVYAPDVEDIPQKKPKVQPIRRMTLPRLNKSQWQYIGAAAAALLLAGALLPKAPSKTVSASLPWHGMAFHDWLSQRATRDFADNFRSGLSQWEGVRPKWPKSWSYSRDGFMHPGQLALYRPSVPLSDYRFEFMAQIENKSVDWVVRAKDADNYYAMKFTVIQPGPRPLVAMVHYPVIGGHVGSRVQTPLRMMIHANTPYRVTVDVKGDRYHAYIEDQEADFWQDDRLKTGGVGFFSEASEHARVYWVKLESHGDFLGRICGLLSGKSSDATSEKEKTQANGLPAHRHEGNQDGGRVVALAVWSGSVPGNARQQSAVEGCFAAFGRQAGRGVERAFAGPG